MPSSSPSQIDYRAFPHIVDLILSFSTPKVVRTFRLTSRHYEELITSRHLERLALRMDGCLASPRGILVIRRGADLRRGILEPEPTAAEKHRLASLLRNTKTLTMYLPPSDWLVFLLPFLDAVYNFAYWYTATIPASRIAVWRTMNLGGLHFIQSGIQSIIIDGCSVPDFIARDRGAPLKVDEIVHIYRSEVDEDLDTLVAGTSLGIMFMRLPLLTCNRVIVVGAPDETAFMEAVRGLGRPEFNKHLQEMEWQFLTGDEYVQTLSAKDKALIPWKDIVRTVVDD